MIRFVLAVPALFLAIIVYYVNELVKKREAIKGLPQPPGFSKWFGHLALAVECQALYPDDNHAHCWSEYLRVKYNLPEVFYVDWRPFGALWIYVADPELAAQYVTTQQSLPKSPWETRYMNKFLGEENMVSLEGPHWKSMRSMFNPGFSSANIMTLVEPIVDASLIFRDILYEKAKTNELFELEEYATRLTMDIIGRVSMGAEMNTQEEGHPIATAFRERVSLMPPGNAILPWQAVDLLRPYKLWRNGRQLDKAIDDVLNAKIEQRAKETNNDPRGSSKRSVVDLALSSYEKEVAMSNIHGEKQGMKTARITSTSQLPGDLRRDIVSSVKTFFFAGHDTSSSTISWICYLLHRNPKVHVKLTEELNEHFPIGTDAASAIKADPYIINKLEYLTAIVKECLRIFPPASTIRYVDPRNPPTYTAITNRKTGEQFPINFPEAAVWPVAYMIHRNPRFYPSPTKFIPERFIPSLTPFPDAELFTPAGKEAFRPFEKGPRSCIGQELAMIEIKIVMALIARELDFVLEYPGEKPDLQFDIPESMAEEFSEESEYGKLIRRDPTKKNRVEGHRVYQVLKGTAKPAGGCPGRIYVRN